MTSIFAYSVLKEGKRVPLSIYKNKVTVIVNTASLCSFNASNLVLLNTMLEKYKSKGFDVLAFPCSQFGNQEPLSTKENFKQWKEEQAIQFTLFDKVNVKKQNVEPLFEMLQHQTGLGTIKWNYTKFVCDRQGVPRVKLAPTSSSAALEAAIESYL